jgi:hypothetical protein
MLATNKNNFQYLYVLAAISIFVLILAIMTYRSGALPVFSAGQSAASDSTTLSPAEVSAYSWNAIARFYEAQSGQASNVNALDLYHQSEWNSVRIPAFHYGPPGR